MLNEHWEMDGLFAVGCPAVIHTNPGDRDEKRYSTVVRGWYQGSYVLLDKPVTDETSTPFAKSQRCLVRFLSEGKACGFPCTLLKIGDNASPYLRVSWPRKLECVDIRKHERLAVRVPCKILRQGQNEVDGETVDVSAGGCGLWTQTRVGPDTSIQVSFHFPDASTVLGGRATVRSARAVGKGFLLGCMFDEGEEACRTCDAFVAAATGHASAGKSQKRALLLESEDVRSDSTRVRLEKKGYLVTTVSSVVDAFFSLRKAPPSCFWVGAGQGGISAVDICRVLRGTRGFESLPIYVIGGNDAGLVNELKRLNVVYVSSIEAMERVLV